MPFLKRHPQYNGGVERANGQLTSYQEAAARYRQRPSGRTYEDAVTALAWANQLTRPLGWQGPTADELWQTRASLVPVERAAFIEAEEQQRRLVYYCCSCCYLGRSMDFQIDGCRKCIT